MKVLSKRSLKTFLNRLIDDTIHPKGKPKTIETVIVDEALHTLVEGRPRPDKFVRYTLLPQLFPHKKRRRKRRRR